MTAPNVVNEWTLADVTVHTQSGERIAAGYVNAAYPGLAITPSRSLNKIGAWSTTHIASGKAFGPDANNLLNATVAVAALAAAGDWTRRYDEIKADAEFRDRARAIRSQLEACAAFEATNRPVEAHVSA